MKSKIIYLIGFIALIWLGMTKTGRDLLSLSNQTSDYTNSHNEYTIRFFGNSQPGLAATIVSDKQGILLSPGQKGSMTFLISNMINERQSISFTDEITPKVYSEFFTVEKISDITLAPSEKKEVVVEFSLKDTISREVDTLYLSLSANKITTPGATGMNEKKETPSKG